MLRTALIDGRLLFAQQIPRASTAAEHADRKQRNAPPREAVNSGLGGGRVLYNVRLGRVLIGFVDLHRDQLAVDRITAGRFQLLDAVLAPWQLGELHEAVVVGGQGRE